MFYSILLDWISLKAGLNNFIIKIFDLVQWADGTELFILEVIAQIGSPT